MLLTAGGVGLAVGGFLAYHHLPHERDSAENRRKFTRTIPGGEIPDGVSAP